MNKGINDFFNCVRENTASVPCAEDFWHHVSGVVLHYQKSDSFDEIVNGSNDEPSDGGRIVSQDASIFMIMVIFMISGVIMVF